MVTVSDLFGECRSALSASGIESEHFDTMCIFQNILGENNIYIIMDDPIDYNKEQKIRTLIKKRAKGYPLQYLLGEWEFYGYPFKVGEGVLIPRPDTETLIDYILEVCSINELKSPKIIDLCSGTGCIAVTLKKEIPDAEIYALEKSEKAFDYLEHNIKLNNVQINTLKMDVLLEESVKGQEDFDIIVSNPPYLTKKDMQELQQEVRFEPVKALYAGEDGLYFYQQITPIWKKALRTGGRIVYEIGINQHESVSDILKSNNFGKIEFIKDTAGIIRVVSGVKQEEE